FPVTAASLPFSIGSVLYHVRDDLPAFGPTVRAVAVAAFAAHSMLASAIYSDLAGAGFYVSLVLVAIVLMTLRSLDDRTHPAGRLDRFLGDLSYPLYLTHFHSALLVSWAAPGVSGVAAAGLGLGTATSLAWAIHRTSETPLARLRGTLR